MLIACHIIVPHWAPFGGIGGTEFGFNGFGGKEGRESSTVETVEREGTGGAGSTLEALLGS